MILLSFIILGHPDLKKTEIKIFALCKEDELSASKNELKNLVILGRLPINEKNVKVILQPEGVSSKTIIAEKSTKAGLTLIGLREEMVKHLKEELFAGYDELGTVLFVNSKNQKAIE